MSDQASSLREMIHGVAPPVRAFSAGPPMIAVTGGRGGVGTTTVAVNLAAVLADGGERVLLVDAAAENNSVAEVAGVRGSQVERTLSDVLAGRCGIAEALVPGPAGMTLLARRGRVSSSRGCEFRRNSPTWGGAEFSRRDQQVLFAELESSRTEFDLLVVDLGSGLSAWTRRFWLHASLVLLVTTADGAALVDSYAALKRTAADGAGPNVRLVVNRCQDDRAAAEADRRFSSACGRFLGRTVPALPSLPSHEEDDGMHPQPRVWERPNTPFGHAMLWLGRAVGDVLSAKAAELVA